MARAGESPYPRLCRALVSYTEYFLRVPTHKIPNALYQTPQLVVVVYQHGLYDLDICLHCLNL